MAPSYGMFAVISGTAILQAASCEDEIKEFVRKAKASKGFEVLVVFDRYTNSVVEMEAHKELKWKLAERAKSKSRKNEDGKKRVPEAEVPKVEGWTL